MNKNNFPNKQQVERVREQYPPGTRIEVTSIEDPYSKLTVGSRGAVEFIDDRGSLFCAFDNGEHIGLLYGIDGYRKIETAADVIKRQILAVRSSAATNMFHWRNVLEIAEQCGFDELVEWLPSHVKAYSGFILTGEFTEE